MEKITKIGNANRVYADKAVNLKIVYDNNKRSPDYQAGWGFSCLVDERILFDTGEASESLFHNMNQLHINPADIEAVVISHNHWDHTGGLWELLKQHPGLPVYACPGFGDDFKTKVQNLKGKLIESFTFRKINSRIAVTGEIPGEYKGKSMPEQALVIKTKNGLTVITGCAHPGIVDIILTVKSGFPNERIQLVLGGFHLMNKEPGEIQTTIARLKELGVASVGPTHCTGNEAQKIFKTSYKDHFISIKVGRQLEI